MSNANTVIVIPDAYAPSDVTFFRSVADPDALMILVEDYGQLRVGVQFSMYYTPYLDEVFFDYDNSTVNPTTIVFETWGTGGNDTIFGIANGGGDPDDVIHGREGNDTIYGENGDDTVHGEAGNDVLDGYTGNDTLHGGDGDDNINGLYDDDTLYGGGGTDTLYGSYGTDTIYGGEGADIIDGDHYNAGLGNDTIYGEGGDDTIRGGAGNDLIDGGSGIDTIVFDNQVTVNLANGSATGGNVGTDTISNIENVTGSNSNDTITGSTAANVLDGGLGTDTLYGGDGLDTLIGGSGLDTLTGGAGANSFVFFSASAFSNVDVIADFSTADNDNIDISDVLDGHYNAGTDLITDFVQITTNGSNSELRVDVTGTASFGAGTHIATLNSVTGLTDEAALVTAGHLLAD